MQIKVKQDPNQLKFKIEYIVKRECTTESKLELKWIAIEFNLKRECETKLVAALGHEKIYFTLKVNSNSSRGRALPLPNQRTGLPAKLLP